MSYPPTTQPPLDPEFYEHQFDQPRQREPDDLAEAIYDALLAANRAYLAGLRQRPALNVDAPLDYFESVKARGL